VLLRAVISFACDTGAEKPLDDGGISQYSRPGVNAVAPDQPRAAEAGRAHGPVGECLQAAKADKESRERAARWILTELHAVADILKKR
jgi:hypothetical protein